MAEYLVPTHDWVYLKAIENHEDVSPGGILMPAAGDYDSLKTDEARRGYKPDADINKTPRRNTNRYEVLDVGPGLYVDVADDVRDQVFLRKPMCCKKGDTVLVQEGAVPIAVDGEIRAMCHDYLILAILRKDADGKEVLDPQHDYIFSKQADVTQKSKGGIFMGTSSDPTGNTKLPDRWEALGVGDGPWALRQETGKIPGWARRPMAVATGDVFAFEGAGFQVVAAGAPMCVIQSYQVAAVFKQVEA